MGFMSTSKIGFFGVGLMGHGIAINLLRHGHDLMVFDHPGNQPIDDLLQGGARASADSAALAQHAELLRQRRLGHTDQGLQFAHIPFPLTQLAQQQQAIRIGQDLHEPAGRFRRRPHGLQVQGRIPGNLMDGLHDERSLLNVDTNSLLTDNIYVNKL